jgi:hypothetical protein
MAWAPAANPQDGHVSVERNTDHVQLKFRALRLNLTERFYWIFAVEARVNIKIAATD